jgi:hypothetical protein
MIEANVSVKQSVTILAVVCKKNKYQHVRNIEFYPALEFGA